MYWIIPICTNVTHNFADKLFFRVPKDPNKRNMWPHAMKENKLKFAIIKKIISMFFKDHFSINKCFILLKYYLFRAINN